MLGDAITPFNLRPEEPTDLPQNPSVIPTEDHLKQCQSIFDDCEARRARIEQKAQWAFAVVAFLVPLLASVFVFIFRTTRMERAGLIVALAFLGSSASLLLLSFLSAARALSIRPTEVLYFDGVIDTSTGDFRPYDITRRAQGLLYCASINSAMNDHMAQLVKGAHLFAAFAVVAFSIGVIPAGLDLMGHAAAPSQTTIVGAVNVKSPELEALRAEVAEISTRLAANAAQTKERAEIPQLLARVAALDAEMAAAKASLLKLPTKKEASTTAVHVHTRAKTQ